MTNSSARMDAQCAVVIVTFNSWKFLTACLVALENQTMDAFRVVVVDNGDASAEARLITERFPRVEYSKSPSNIGFAAGVNQGVAIAGGCDWIVLLNPDTEPEPSFLERLTAAALEHPEHPLFGGRLLQADDPSVLDGDGDSYHVSGFAWRSGMGRKAETAGDRPHQAFAACAAAALIRRDVFLDAGGLDEDFFCYMEDVDLGFRLRLMGYSCLIVPAARVRHKGSAITGKRSAFYAYHGQRNLVWTYVKNMPSLLLWLFLPLHILLNVAAVLRHSLNGNLGVVLRAKRDAVAGLPSALRKRRVVQARRVVSASSILQALDKGLIPDRAISELWK